MFVGSKLEMKVSVLRWSVCRGGHCVEMVSVYMWSVY